MNWNSHLNNLPLDLMAEIPKRIESAEVQNDSAITQTQSWVRRGINGVVNGVNDAVEVAGTATGYTLGRTGRTIKQTIENVVKGAKGGSYGQAA